MPENLENQRFPAPKGKARFLSKKPCFYGHRANNGFEPHAAVAGKGPGISRHMSPYVPIWLRGRNLLQQPPGYKPGYSLPASPIPPDSYQVIFASKLYNGCWHQQETPYLGGTLKGSLHHPGGTLEGSLLFLYSIALKRLRQTGRPGQYSSHPLASSELSASKRTGFS